MKYQYAITAAITMKYQYVVTAAIIMKYQYAITVAITAEQYSLYHCNKTSQTEHGDTVSLLLQSRLHFTHLPYTCGRHVPEVSCTILSVSPVGRTATHNCYNISFCFRMAKDRLRDYFRFSNRKLPRRSEFPSDGQQQQPHSTHVHNMAYSGHAGDAKGIAEPSVEPKFHYQQDLTSS
jgi:hypothetical protein